ncbi:MAG: glycoside hydrolase family 3 protein, partial [Slackia sp.]
MLEKAVLLENDGILPLQGTEKVAVIGRSLCFRAIRGGSSPTRSLDMWSAFLDAGGDAGTPRLRCDIGRFFEGCSTKRPRRRKRRCGGIRAFRPSNEGFIPKLMVMPKGHVSLIERVCAANSKTVVVLQGGSPMEMPWRNGPAAILLMYLSGCRGGHATVDILTGRVNPSGKLAETWPVCLHDTALGRSFPDTDREVLYRE